MLRRFVGFQLRFLVPWFLKTALPACVSTLGTDQTGGGHYEGLLREYPQRSGMDVAVVDSHFASPVSDAEQHRMRRSHRRRHQTYPHHHHRGAVPRAIERTVFRSHRSTGRSTAVSLERCVRKTPRRYCTFLLHRRAARYPIHRGDYIIPG